MGGLSGHGTPSYAAQTVAFLISLALPGAALALVAGAYWEQFRRRLRNRSGGEQGSRRISLAAEYGAE